MSHATTWLMQLLGRHHSAQALSVLNLSRQNPRVILFTLIPQIGLQLDEISTRNGWETYHALGWTDVAGLIEEHATGIVLLDRSRLGGEWKEEFRRLLTIPGRSCVILVEATDFGNFSKDFLTEGGYAVLVAPLIEEQVVHMVQGAWAFWKHCMRTH